MKQTVSILGCGWLGIPLADLLISNKYTIKGSTTKHSKIELLSSHKIKAYVIDIENETNKLDDFLDSDILIIAITSKNIESFKQLINRITTSKINTVIFISSTSVYSNNNSVVTEETETNNSALAEIERLFISNTKINATILRFAGLIGYNRKPGNFIKPDNIIRNPEGFVNMIHQDDCIEIIKEIIEKDIKNITLNACTDSHPTRADYYTKEMKKVGRCNPKLETNSTSAYKIVSNSKLKSLLGYNFKLADLMSDY